MNFIKIKAIHIFSKNKIFTNYGMVGSREKKNNETKQIWMSISPKMSFYYNKECSHFIKLRIFFNVIK